MCAAIQLGVVGMILARNHPSVATDNTFNKKDGCSAVAARPVSNSSEVCHQVHLMEESSSPPLTRSIVASMFFTFCS